MTLRLIQAAAPLSLSIRRTIAATAAGLVARGPSSAGPGAHSAMRSAGFPGELLIGSPIDFADRLIGSPDQLALPTLGAHTLGWEPFLYQNLMVSSPTMSASYRMRTTWLNSLSSLLSS